MSETERFVYVGFWKRVGAALVDALIGFALMPVSLPLIYFSFSTKNLLPLIAFNLVWTLIWLWFIVKKGGTPGKLVIGARIVDEQGQYLSWGGAFLRMLFPYFLHSLISLFQMGSAISNIEEGTVVDTFLGMGYAMQKADPIYATIGMVLSLSFYVNILVVLCNKKKKAIHDYIAGSVVVTKQSRDDYLSVS